MPPLDAIHRGVERIRVAWPDAVRIPDDRDRERLAQKILARIKDWDWNDVKTSHIVSAAIAIFDKERREREDLEIARQFYFDEIIAREAGSFLDAMLWVYVESFESGAQHASKLAKALNERRSDFGSKAAKLLNALPDLFSVDAAPMELAKIMLAADDPFSHLQENGLRAPHACGLAHAAHSQFIKLITPELKESDARCRLFAWLCPEHGSALQTGAEKAVEALLKPWQDETPPEEVRHEISEKIIAAYNDPRLHKGGIWAGFDPDLKTVLLRWLTKQDMKFFCDMVTATQNSHMWPPRRDFWLGLYDDGMIDEAWVAFGGDARQYARQHLLHANSDDLGRRFGRQFDRGGSTSILIMRIGNKIVVDGCHNYRTHIFPVDDQNAPKLYQRDYYCDRIMHSSQTAKPHGSIPNWKEWVLRHV